VIRIGFSPSLNAFGVYSLWNSAIEMRSQGGDIEIKWTNGVRSWICLKRGWWMHHERLAKLEQKIAYPIPIVPVIKA
jgi:hypothetical protein